MDLPNFNYPKNIFRNQSNILSGSRPQPSPSKSEQFMKDLGLDEVGSTDTSTSSEEDEIDSRPSEIEMRILQKELDACNEQSQLLKERNRELQSTVNRLNNRLKKEENSKRMRLKILQRAFHDNMKDKQKLIVNLQELIEDSGDAECLGLVASIEKLHEEKSKLHQELMNAQQDYEDKVNEIEKRYSETGRPLVDPASVQALEKVTEEKVRLLMEMEKMEKAHADQVTSYEDLLKEKESELIRANQEKEKKNRSHNSIKLKLETLKKEVDANKRTQHEKERELEGLLRKQKDENERLKGENVLVQKQLATLEGEMTSRLNSELSESSAKLESEKRKLAMELERSRVEVNQLQHNKTELATLREDVERIKVEHKQLKADLLKSEAELERHKASAKEKLRFAEHELEESRLSLQQHRRAAASDVSELKQLMERNEKQLKREIDEANQACRDQKNQADKSMERLEEKLQKSKSKVKNFEDQVSELKGELVKNTSEIASLLRNVESANEETRQVTSQLKEQSNRLEAERKKCDDLSGDLRRTQVERESFERQLSVLSGKSDSVISRMETESRELRLELSAIEERLRVTEREKGDMERRGVELETKISDLDRSFHSDADRHKIEVERLSETHKRELMKLKASSAIATEALTSRKSALESALRLALSTLHQMSRDRKMLRSEVEKFPGLLKDAIKRAAKQVSDAVAEISETNKELVRRYTKEMALRKKYHNQLVELRGNIRVFVRVRPIISEDGRNAKKAISYDISDDAIIYVNNPQKGRSQTFEMDRVFPGGSTQEQVYAEVQALVTSCIDGYHVCIFAYGQTGSGKTYTMEGTTEQPGINQRALDDLFRLIDERSRDWEYNVSVSLVEIYNETLRDLLNAKPEKLEIKMNPDGSLFVQRLKRVQVRNLDDVNRVFRTGHSNRSTASTNMNERSSRSHAVLMVIVEGTNKTTELSTTGRLNLIDLAGSERVSKSGASGDRLKEAQNINRSLSALGDVIHALRNKQGHVPFRNSKLTYLLQDSLSKESKTLMVVQVSPIEASLSETVCSLNFAQRVRAVELGQATRKTKVPAVRC